MFKNLTLTILPWSIVTITILTLNNPSGMDLIDALIYALIH